MNKWFIGSILFLFLLTLALGLWVGKRTTPTSPVSQIKYRGLVDINPLEHRLDLISMLKYPPTKEGDAGKYYLEAVKNYQDNQVLSINSSHDVVYNANAPQLDYLLEGAKYKMCDTNSFISTCITLNKPTYDLYDMTKALIEKGNQYIRTGQPEKGLQCYEAGVLLGYYMTVAECSSNISFYPGIEYGNYSLKSLLNYYKKTGDKLRVHFFQDYMNENEELARKYSKKDDLLFPVNFKNTPVLFYEYTDLSKPFSIDTNTLEALIEMALFDKTPGWRKSAVNSLGSMRYYTQDKAFGIAYQSSQKDRIDNILDYIRKNDADKTLQKEAEIALHRNSTEAKNEIIRILKIINSHYSRHSKPTTQRP